MKEPDKKGLPTCRTSESIVNHDEKVGGETLEGSVDSGARVQMEGSFSEELVGGDGACNGKDVMVEVLGSDVYIDGVCTRGTGAELNDEVGCGGSVEDGGNLDKDVKSAGISNGTEARLEGSQAMGSHEAGSDNAASELDGAVSGREERGHAVERINALDSGIPGQKVANTRSDNANALGCSLTVSSVGGKNVQSVCAEKDEQQEKNLTDHGATDDGDDVTLKTWDEQNNNIVGKLNSVGVQPMGINRVDDDSSTVTLPQEVVGGAEFAADKALLNSEGKQCSRLEKCTEKEQMADTSQFSSDTGQKVDVDKVVGGDFALDDSCPTKVELNKNVSDSEQCHLHKGMEMEVEDRPETERVKIMDNTTEIKDTLVDASAISMIVEEDAHVADQGHYAPSGARKEKFHDESNIRQNAEVQASISELAGSNGCQEIEVEEFDEAEQRKATDGKVIKRASMRLGNLEIVHQARYLLPKEKEGEFSVSDMVWSKVRSHPWWPGQIFDPSDSSEKAMKHYKKDCYLVAYFGDRTFAWNEASQLKPFRTNFSSIEKQSNSESFQNAVDCALDEITRRVQFGLACSCIPKDTYDMIKCQTVENTGIRQELSVRHGVDESLNASSFSPDKLIEYLKTLSVLPTGGFDRLELVIAKAQLLAFYRFKGYSCLPELQYCGGLDNDMDTLIHGGEKNLNEVEHVTPVCKNDGQSVPTNLKSQSTSCHKRKHNLKDSLHPTKKERSLSELMSGTPDSPDGDYWSEEKVTDNVVLPSHSKKRRTMDHYADDSGMQDGRKTISLAKVSNTIKQSFKIGECIRRVASQLTGSPSVLKCSGDRSQKTDGSTDVFSGNGSDVSLQNFDETQRSGMGVPTEHSSLDNLLSSLKWVALEPLGDYSFLNATVSFFSDFRNSIVVADDSGKEITHTDKVGTKRKKPSIAGSPETFEFEDMSDTYWTDRVIDNVPEEQPPRRNRKIDYQLVLAEPGKPVQVSRRSNSRKRYSDSNHAEGPEKPPGYIDENAPAELVMNFAELDSVPSETSLNKMFRHFGPLKESETEVDRVSSRARVIFKKCTDAEVACSSAKRFNIFGPILVNYELNYTPSALFKASSVATTHDQEMHLDLSNFEVNMV